LSKAILSRRVAGAVAVALVIAACGAQKVSSRPAAGVPRPDIVTRLIPFGADRRAETAAYARRHYGIDTWRLRHPHVIVEHYTASDSFESAYSYFVSNTPNLGELPGVCAHFIIDRDGTIYRLVRLDAMCRHTVGLNYTAFGIEHVGTSDAQILANPRQMRSSLALTGWLMYHYGMQLGNVIGHNESLTSRYHHERVASWRCQTHGDWNRGDMNVYRRRLAALVRRYGVPLGPPARLVDPHC
jgi:N-acetylmuramoyl-L-alanine amidase